MKRIFLVESDQTARDHTDEAVHQLDNLRSEFLLELSHQLRTPVTAIKLAMDGLLSQIGGTLTPSQQDLAGISRRNIERIVALVENQLDLLQMMSGERVVCRRLTNLNQLLHDMPRLQLGLAASGLEGNGDEGRSETEVCDGLGAKGPLYTFTDPELLAAVVDCTMGLGPTGSRRHIRFDYDRDDQAFRLELRVDLPGRTSDGNDQVEDDSLLASDFESRACRAMVDRLGGDLVTGNDERQRWVRLRLPRYPEYDGEKDFVGPVRLLKSMSAGRAGAEGEGPAAVQFVRCDVGEATEEHTGVDFLAVDNSAAGGLFESIRSILRERDAVVRGPRHGSIYVALLDRTQRELDHIEETLRLAGGAGVRVWDHQAILAEEREFDRLARDLHLV